MMLPRSSVGRSCIKALQRQCVGHRTQTRSLAAAASGSFQYETGEEAGVKYASRDLPGPTTTLTVVAKAGTRYQAQPGFSDALEKFAFKVRCPWGATVIKHSKLRFFGSVNHEAISCTNYQRGRASRRRRFCLSFTRESCHPRKVPPRRSGLLYRAPVGCDIEDQVCT